MSGAPLRNPEPKDKPELKLIKGTHKVSEPSYRLIFTFLGASSLILGILLLITPGTRLRLDELESRFLSLDTQFQNEGLDSYLKRKRDLGRAVASALEDASDPARQQLATNIAVYLFPELLPETDFEKPVAVELWGEAMKAIEASPGTPEARIQFENLRANIWNYEVVDRENPKLSAPARQAIQIYDTLSGPKRND